MVAYAYAVHNFRLELHCVKSVQIPLRLRPVCVQITLRPKCPSFLWSVFSRIRTEYGEILRISPYSVRMREDTDQKKLCNWTLFTQCYTHEYLCEMLIILNSYMINLLYQSKREKIVAKDFTSFNN